MLRWVRRPLAVLLGTLHLCTACYQYVPIRSAPTVGSRVALEINDDGRIALRDQLGPGIVRLEGRLSAVYGDSMVVEALNVTQIRGQALPVANVLVRVSPQHVERMDERRLSRSRTWLVIGGAAAIVATFLLSGGFGGRTPTNKPPDGPPIDEYRGQ